MRRHRRGFIYTAWGTEACTDASETRWILSSINNSLYNIQPCHTYTTLSPPCWNSRYHEWWGVVEVCFYGTRPSWPFPLWQHSFHRNQTYCTRISHTALSLTPFSFPYPVSETVHVSFGIGIKTLAWKQDYLLCVHYENKNICFACFVYVCLKQHFLWANYL